MSMTWRPIWCNWRKACPFWWCGYIFDPLLLPYPFGAVLHRWPLLNATAWTTNSKKTCLSPANHRRCYSEKPALSVAPAQKIAAWHACGGSAETVAAAATSRSAQPAKVLFYLFTLKCRGCSAWTRGSPKRLPASRCSLRRLLRRPGAPAAAEINPRTNGATLIPPGWSGLLRRLRTSTSPVSVQEGLVSLVWVSGVDVCPDYYSITSHFSHDGPAYSSHLLLSGSCCCSFQWCNTIDNEAQSHREHPFISFILIRFMRKIICDILSHGNGFAALTFIQTSGQGSKVMALHGLAVWVATPKCHLCQLHARVLQVFLCWLVFIEYNNTFNNPLIRERS